MHVLHTEVVGLVATEAATTGGRLRSEDLLLTAVTTSDQQGLHRWASGQGEGGSPKPPLSCGKKNPWWCKSQGLSTLADLNLTHLCDQVVISARGVDDKV